MTIFDCGCYFRGERHCPRHGLPVLDEADPVLLIEVERVESPEYLVLDRLCFMVVLAWLLILVAIYARLP